MQNIMIRLIDKLKYPIRLHREKYNLLVFRIMFNGVHDKNKYTVDLIVYKFHKK